jgi:hypothetical protein
VDGEARGTARIGSALRRAPDRDQARALLVFVLPGIWVAVVLALEFAMPARIQLAPLLAAAPAIACAATGRRQCVVLAGLCALFALLPFKSDGGQIAGLGERFGTFGAILSVAVASFVISERRQRSLRDLTQVQAIAEVAQQVLLRPPRPEIGDVRVAVRYASATAGAVIGGDFYEVVDTRYGVRAVIGDVRGSGLDAVECASVLLGSFREAAHDEPDLREVVRRLDVSLRRHLGDGYLPGRSHSDHLATRAPQSSADVLTLVRPPELDIVREEFASAAVVSIRRDGRLELVNCGHPAPYLIQAGIVSPLEPAAPCLPLGLGGLASTGLACRGVAEVPFDTGDSVLLFTDGVTEARDGDGCFFALSEALCRVVDAEPDGLVSAIDAGVDAHTGGARTITPCSFCAGRDRRPTSRCRSGSPSQRSWWCS